VPGRSAAFQDASLGRKIALRRESGGARAVEKGNEEDEGEEEDAGEDGARREGQDGYHELVDGGEKGLEVVVKG
jgi:hypothetical protein